MTGSTPVLPGLFKWTPCPLIARWLPLVPPLPNPSGPAPRPHSPCPPSSAPAPRHAALAPHGRGGIVPLAPPAWGDGSALVWPDRSTHSLVGNPTSSKKQSNGALSLGFHRPCARWSSEPLRVPFLICEMSTPTASPLAGRELLMQPRSAPYPPAGPPLCGRRG